MASKSFTIGFAVIAFVIIGYIGYTFWTDWETQAEINAFLEEDLSIAGILEVKAPTGNETDYQITKLEINITSASILNLTERFSIVDPQFAVHVCWNPGNRTIGIIDAPYSLLLNMTAADPPTMNDLWHHNIFEDHTISDPSVDIPTFVVILNDKLHVDCQAMLHLNMTATLV